MADLRRVTDDFAVAPQLRPEDMTELAASGVKLVINNRPDAEVEDQPTAAELAKAARAAGVDYVHVPVRGPATPDQIAAVAEAVAGADGPVVAFCRSGTRSITTWAKGQTARGQRSRDELVALARNAGYDLSGSLG